MSLISRSLQTKRLPPGAVAPNYQLIQGRLVSISDNTQNYITSGYNINDIIYSIVKLITDKIRVAPWSMYKVDDEQALKAYTGMQKKSLWNQRDYLAARDFRHKALKPAKNPGKWGELMMYANSDDTMSDFIAYGAAWRLLTGNKFTYGAPLKGGVNKGVPYELLHLPAQWTQVLASDTFPVKRTGYNVQTFNRAFTTEEVLHEKEWNPNWNIQGDQLYGMAPLRAALKLTNRDNSSLDASTSRFQNRGIDGILALRNDVSGVDGAAAVAQVRELKKTMMSEWTGERNQGKFGISGYSLDWIPVGLTAEEMQQIENEMWNLRRLCNPFGVPSQLLNDPDNKTFNSLEEAEKALTTRCAMPQLVSARDNLNRKGRKEWGMPSGMIADFDMTVYTELQEDMGDLVTWLDKLVARGYPLNSALDILQLPRVDRVFDQSWVTPAMGVPLNEWQPNEVDESINEDDPEEDI